MLSRETLEAAFTRFSADVGTRAFYAYPATLPLVRQHSREWLDALVSRVADGNYGGHPARIVEVPKPGWHIRMGSVLSLEDQVVYSALGLAALKSIRDVISWSAPDVRFSHRLADADRKYWFRQTLSGWKAFDRVSLGRLNDGARYVVVADIAGFYDNIEVARVVRELQATNIDPAVPTLLSRCLNQWSQQRGRGIPQGHSVSDLIAECFLDPIDKQLQLQQFDHLRYNDDIRVFTSTEREARLAVRALTRLLHERGLNLQSAKTRILRKREARRMFERVPAWLSGVARKLREAMTEAGSDEYVSPSELGKHLRSDADSPAPSVVEAAWDDFADQSAAKFDKSIFHYLLNRLADMGSPRAVEFAVGLLQGHPEETGFVLKYLARLEPAHRAVEKVAAVLVSHETIHDYQRFEIVRWACENSIADSGVLQFARRAISGSDSMLRVQCLLYLGDHAEGSADVDTLQRVLTQSTDTEIRAAAACALRATPRAQKAPILNRARGQNQLLDWSIDHALST